MSHGLTLTAANTIVWFAPINSNDIYQQANARIERPGQKLNTLVVHIEGSDLERKMYSRLMNKGAAQGALLDLFEEGQKVES
jgi:SNF2 family DNA or RNA helicase